MLETERIALTLLTVVQIYNRNSKVPSLLHDGKEIWFQEITWYGWLFFSLLTLLTSEIFEKRKIHFTFATTRPISAAAAAKSLQSCPTLCDRIDSSPPGSSVPGILQARVLEWVAISFSNAYMHAKSLQLCPTLCDPTDSSPPGSSLHGIL